MNRSTVSPHQVAQKLLARLNIKVPPVSVERIAKALGAEVRFAPFDDELSGMIYIQNGTPIIGVNSLHHPNRRRFTLAHELGHLELHREMISTNVHVDKKFPILMRDSTSSSGTELVEIQANEFAAELLMPSEMLDAELLGRQFDIDDDAPMAEIARKFRVSKQALEYRIRNQYVRVKH